jgi:hypothetical protein
LRFREQGLFLAAFDVDDCLLGVCEKAGVENDPEIAEVKNAIEMINAKAFTVFSLCSIFCISVVQAPAVKGCGWFLLEAADL